MRKSLIRLSFVAALVAALAMVGTATASADTTSCAAAGTIKLSPGLTSDAKVQNVTIKAALSECSGEESEFTGGKFVAHFKTAEPVSCSTLTGEGTGAAPEENKIVLKWTPKGSGNSLGTVSLPITEVPGALLTGSIASGPFEEDNIAGELSQSYTGGSSCGVPPEGKKKAKKVKKGTVSGTLAITE
jgi:hypothetical protein